MRLKVTFRNMLGFKPFHINAKDEDDILDNLSRQRNYDMVKEVVRMPGQYGYVLKDENGTDIGIASAKLDWADWAF